MLVEISKDQAKRLCSNYNIIVREGKFFSFKEFQQVNKNKINNSKGKFYLYVSGNIKKEFLRISNLNMINGLLSSIFFCIFFMNFAILTRAYSDVHLVLMIINFLISFHLFMKALSRKPIDDYLKTLYSSEI